MTPPGTALGFGASESLGVGRDGGGEVAGCRSWLKKQQRSGISSRPAWLFRDVVDEVGDTSAANTRGTQGRAH